MIRDAANAIHGSESEEAFSPRFNRGRLLRGIGN